MEEKYGFKQRVDNSINKVVNTVANTGEQFFIVDRGHSPDAHVGVNVLLYMFSYVPYGPEIKHYYYYY